MSADEQGSSSFPSGGKAHTTLDCEDAFYGEGFGTGVTLDIGPSPDAPHRTVSVLLCVRSGFNTPKRAMRLYVTT